MKHSVWKNIHFLLANKNTIIIETQCIHQYNESNEFTKLLKTNFFHRYNKIL